MACVAGPPRPLFPVHALSAKSSKPSIYSLLGFGLSRLACSTTHAMAGRGGGDGVNSFRSVALETPRALPVLAPPPPAAPTGSQLPARWQLPRNREWTGHPPAHWHPEGRVDRERRRRDSLSQHDLRARLAHGDTRGTALASRSGRHASSFVAGPTR